ncbi:hypothetical protein KSP39_PZI019938 [Platanthera zijinensis]|uniref:Uncharacterized protein n=1 Tax=Platanthera zijinensis TaxID=2320716 RepID=A0AAP0AZ82_9ASPA
MCSPIISHEDLRAYLNTFGIFGSLFPRIVAPLTSRNCRSEIALLHSLTPTVIVVLHSVLGSLRTRIHRRIPGTTNHKSQFAEKLHRSRGGMSHPSRTSLHARLAFERPKMFEAEENRRALHEKFQLLEVLCLIEVSSPSVKGEVSSPSVQSVVARERTKCISMETQELILLIPDRMKMNTANILKAAREYEKSGEEKLLPLLISSVDIDYTVLLAFPFFKQHPEF